jgi:hypothetical protein
MRTIEMTTELWSESSIDSVFRVLGYELKVEKIPATGPATLQLQVLGIRSSGMADRRKHNINIQGCEGVYIGGRLFIYSKGAREPQRPSPAQ